MTSSKVTSGVGTRYASVFVLNTTTGLPNVDGSLATGTLTQGTLIQGIQDFTPNDPPPQRFTHYGDDGPFAQDSLAPTTVGDFVFTTAKKNMTVDAVVGGLIVNTYDNIPMIAGDSDKRGQEPLVMFTTYRQSLDTEKTSSTFGKLRQWDLKIFPSSRIAQSDQPFAQGLTKKTYQGTPTLVSQTPFSETFTSAKWGNTLATFLEATTDYQPRVYVGSGNGTVTKFALPHAPAATDHVHVWVAGTLTAPASVSLTDPSFTMTVAPANNAQIFVINETNQPGTS